jgi:transposase
MRSQGRAEELERRRQLAVQRVGEGYRQKEVAAFLGVHPVTVNGWMRAYRQSGEQALASKPVPGRPRKLSPKQEKTVLSWLEQSPTSFGFADELWTSRRLATLIEERFGVHFNSNYLVEWLAQRKHSAQKPSKRALEGDEPAIERWLEEEWPRLQKKPGKKKLISCSSMKAASS